MFGTLLAWVLVRYEFPGRRFIDAMVDFPFALPTAVAGLTLANLFAANGWLGQYLVPLGIKGAFTPLGVVIALTFVGMPFVVRTLQPVLENFESEVEEAAATLGAGPAADVRERHRAVAVAAGDDGFRAGVCAGHRRIRLHRFHLGQPALQDEIAPYLIVMRLEEYDYAGAMALAVVLLVFSFRAAWVPSTCSKQWASRFQQLTWPEPSKKSGALAAADITARDGRIAVGRSGRSSASRWLFSLVFLLLPLVNVFAQALRQRLDAITGGR